ncbi:uncharacterized protein [Lolium perenne]|uniref:uncharacterized protein n=1 Tax=Lolium perenne TaxID=4522 RepID=UPI0021F5F6B2|nr:uncharacterized protein LOC127316872 [Lolium perenne]
MTDLAVPMSMKRKDVEVVDGHGFSIFFDPKRIKLQNVKIQDMMEEDEPLIRATAPTLFHDQVDILSEGKSPEPPSKFREAQNTMAAPMEVVAETLQQQPCQNAHLFSGFF